MVFVASITCKQRKKGMMSRKGFAEAMMFCLMTVVMFTFGGGALETEDEDGPYVVYTNGVTSERNLPLCAGPREACNVVRQRFWLPDIVYRMCKCPDRTNCPTEFTDFTDKRTVAFNPRAQLKFCTRVGELEHCAGKGVAAGIRSNGTIHIHCYCGPGHFYQRLYKNSTGQYFKCVPYGSCQKGELCGYIAEGFYETYHSCTCPRRQICILQDRNKVYVDEFLYKGLAYRGFCMSKN